MAEFCLECWNKINQSEDSAEKYIFSEDLDLCECCGEWKPVIVKKRQIDYSEKNKSPKGFFRRWIEKIIFTYYEKYAKIEVINNTGDRKNARDKRKNI